MRLFKYFSPAKLSDFASRFVSLTPPKYLNDPFEFAVQHAAVDAADYGRMFDQFVLDEYRACVANGGRPIALSAFKKAREEFRQAWLSRVMDRAYLDTTPHYMQEQLSKIFGVVCMSEVADSALMWAHYSDSYRGFVAEFECPHYAEADGLPAVATPFGLAFPCDYSAAPPVLNADHSNACRCVCTKPQEWAYEREWRVVRMLRTADRVDGNRHAFLRFSPAWLKRVICGHRMEERHRTELETAFRETDAAHVVIDTASPDPIGRCVRFTSEQAQESRLDLPRTE